MSSLRKESTVSSLDSRPSAMGIVEPPSTPCQRNIHAYPRSSPNRPVYLALRSLCILSGIILVALSIAANHGTPRRNKWMSPILSPAITSALASAIDVFFVLARDSRCHPMQRLLYDGAIGIGFAIGGGFLVNFTLPDLTRSEPTSTPTTQGVGAAILFLMFSSMLIQWCLAFNGGKQLLRIRREKRAGHSQV